MKKYYLISIILVLTALKIYAVQPQFNVLVYTSPDKWHDAVIPTAIMQFKKMSVKHNFGLTWSQQPDSFTDKNLEEFSVVVFLQSNGETLDTEQMASLKKYIRNGGGFVGIHAASVPYPSNDEWFQKLIGRAFTRHPLQQTGILNVVDRNFPSNYHLPEKWVWTDEWYEFGEALSDNLHVLLTVDESSYNVKRGGDNQVLEDTGMGNFHPIAWYQDYDGGRSFFTALGHVEESYNDPLFLSHIYGGIYWAATGKGVNK
jgi:uncharacterized protein